MTNFAAIPFRYRPIDEWPGEPTPDRDRRRAPFKAGWASTLRDLQRELSWLDAHTVVCQVALEEKDFRVTDGHPRAQARASHPGVVLAFESKYGPLKYATDVFDDFTDNMRAIALGLEALRKVERYGITRRGEQYKGWQQLGAGVATGQPMSRDEAARVLSDLAYDTTNHADDILRYPASAVSAYKFASKRHHPDRDGGDAELFRRATEARDVVIA